MEGKLVPCILIFCLLTSCTDDLPDAVEARDCTSCHTAQALAWENFSSHKAIFECEMCHEATGTSPGPGHRAEPGCDLCHSEEGHPPDQDFMTEARNTSCVTCHNPHGSENLYLIRESVMAGPGVFVTIDFRNVEGRADYSFAELGEEEGGENGLEPGSGLCEVCHVGTIYYTRDASGEDHFTTRCSGCHNHAIGFDT